MKREDIRAGIVVRAIHGAAIRRIESVRETCAMTSDLDGGDRYPLDISALEMFWMADGLDSVKGDA